MKNWGREASSYLQFIIEHYDDLPPRMIFVHGHNSSWHLRVSTPFPYSRATHARQRRMGVQDITRALRAVDPMAYTFATIANMFVCFRADFVTLANCWESMNATPRLGTLPVEVSAGILVWCRLVLTLLRMNCGRYLDGREKSIECAFPLARGIVAICVGRLAVCVWIDVVTHVCSRKIHTLARCAARRSSSRRSACWAARKSFTSGCWTGS